jgi:hypothetical protein
MAFNKFISKKVKSSSSDGDFLTIGNVVTSQTYFHGFQSLTTIDQMVDFGSDTNFINYDVVGVANQSGIITNTTVDIGNDPRSVCDLFNLGSDVAWIGFSGGGSLGTTGLVSGSQMLGFPNSNTPKDNSPRFILLQGFKNYKTDWINTSGLTVSGVSVDWNDPLTYAGIPVFLFYQASPFQGLTVTPPTGTGDTVRCVGFIFGLGALSGQPIIFFDPDGFYAVV